MHRPVKISTSHAKNKDARFRVVSDKQDKQSHMLTSRVSLQSPVDLTFTFPDCGREPKLLEPFCCKAVVITTIPSSTENKQIQQEIIQNMKKKKVQMCVKKSWMTML